MELAQQLADRQAALDRLMAHKRRLSSFFVTPVNADPLPPPPEHVDPSFTRAAWPPAPAQWFHPDVPPCVPPEQAHGPVWHMIATQTVVDVEAATYPIYFLPKKMLPAQEDLLNQQEQACDDAIDEAKREWEEEKVPLQKELKEVLTHFENLKQAST